jgi:hypothetical protein
MTTYVCGGGSCNAVSGVDTDTAGCARNTDGVRCGPSFCRGLCECDPWCRGTRDCEEFICSQGTCTDQLIPRLCGICQPPPNPRKGDYGQRYHCR